MKSVLQVCHQLVTLLLIASLLTASARGADFTFTAIPDQDTTRLQERFGKIADYLSEELGITVKYIPVKSYSASVQAFKNNEVQLAWFGGLSGVQARLSQFRTQSLSRKVRKIPTSLVISSPIPVQDCRSLKNSRKPSLTRRSPSVLRDPLQAASCPNISSERHLRGRHRVRSFKRVGFSGDHSKTLALVQAGSYEVGAMNFKVWLKEVEAGKVDPKKVQVIWRTPGYPDYNWTIRGSVEETYGEGFIKKVQQALLDITDPAILNAFPRAKFIPADNSMYQPILDTAIEVGIIRN